MIFSIMNVDKVMCRRCGVVEIDTEESCLWMCRGCHSKSMAEMLDIESRGDHD